MNRKTLKAELKVLAAVIRTDRKNYRKAQSEGNDPGWTAVAKLGKAIYEFRHKHIAYCSLRGRDRDAIERPKPENKPNESYIADLIIAYSGVRCAETIRPNAS